MINRPSSYQESRNNGNYTASATPQPMRTKSPLLPSNPTSNIKNPLTFDDFMSPPSSDKANAFEHDQLIQNTSSRSSVRKIPNNISYQSQSSYLVLSNSRPKQGNLLQFKELAKQKETMMLKRKTSATKIQSLYRGYKQRKKFKFIWEKHLEKLRLECLSQICQRIKDLFAPFIILRALQKWVQIRRNEKARVMNLFRQYSALFIQKVWKGYRVRLKVGSTLDRKRVARNTIKALVRGWKIRKIMKSEEIFNFKQELKDLVAFEAELREQDINNFQYLQIQNQIPLLKEKIAREIDYLYISAEYLQIFTPHKPLPSSQKPIFTQNYFIKSEKITEINPELPELKIPVPCAYFSRDELPVKSNEFIDDSEQVEPFESVSSEPPAKRFTNFLRRGQNSKYNPS